MGKAALTCISFATSGSPSPLWHSVSVLLDLCQKMHIALTTRFLSSPVPWHRVMSNPAAASLAHESPLWFVVEQCTPECYRNATWMTSVCLLEKGE